MDRITLPLYGWLPSSRSTSSMVPAERDPVFKRIYHEMHRYKRSFDISFFLSSCRSITSETCHKNPYRSLQIFGIQDYGKWPVINKAHLHIGSEHSGFSLKSGIPALIDNMLI